MCPRPVSATPDIEKSKEQLVAELQELRVRNAFLEQCNGRAEPLPLDTDLTEYESMTRLLLNQKLYGIWVNAGGKIAYINEVGAQILGASSPADLIGKSVLDEIIHPDYRNAVSDRIKVMCGGDTVEPLIEEKFIRVDGSVVDVDVWAISFIYRGEPAFLVAFKDITVRKRAEEALSKNLAVLAKSQEIAHLGSWTIDFDTGRFELSDEMYRIHGFEPGAVQPTLDLSTKLTHPDDLKKYLEYIESIRNDGRLTDIDYRILWPDGSIHYMHARTDSVVRGPDGKVKIASGITQDITERKRAEEALRESEERFRQLADNSPIPMAINDKDDNIIYLNKKFIEVFGYTLEVIPRLSSWWHLAYPDPQYRKEAIKRWEKGVEEAVWESKEIGPLDYIVTCKDGSVRYTEISGVPIGDKELVLLQDVTERKRAEEALRKSEEKYRIAADMQQLIMDNVPQGIFWKDRHLTYLGCNKVFARAVGLASVEEIVGKTDYDLPWTPEQTASYREYDRRIMENDAPEYGIVEQLRDVNGKVAWVETNKVPLHDTRGDVMGILGTYEDITERKRDELELEEAKARAELYLDLMGHDINNMNQSAQGFLELALQTLEMDGKIGRGGKLFIEKPLQALRSSSRLISNVRKLQRLTDEGIKTMPVDLHDLFEELKAHDYDADDREVTINVHEAPHYIVGGSDLLRDVFLNLITNAVKHSEPERRLTIDVGVERVNQDGRIYYRCTVEDNGPGVPDQLKPKLFHRFQRGKTQVHGKGLGLYLVRTLVEGYHGKVWVEDRVAGDHTKGARFVVLLPAA